MIVATPKIVETKENTSIVPSHLDVYFDKINQLKSDHQWREILLLGELALMSSRRELEQKATIHAQLASTSFYLGDYKLCAEHANKSLLLAKYLDHTDATIRSLYLLSACQRTLANRASNEAVQNKLFNEARSYIDQALNLFNSCNDDFIKAKVFFNGAAAQADDPHGDYPLAICWYQKAMATFKKLDKLDDYSRCAIRLARLFLQTDDTSKCQEILNEINYDTLVEKTKVHYQLINAKLLIATNHQLQACSVIVDAIERAAILEMKADLDHLNTLLKTIKGSETSDLNLQHFKC